MARSPHIIIVGAGLIGLSSADALVRKGCRVTVLERRPHVMGGASFANSGMLHPSQACSWTEVQNNPSVDDAVFRLASQSLEILQNRMQSLGLEDSLSRPAGCFQIFESHAEADAAFKRLKSRGVTVERDFPQSSPFDRPAIFFPNDRSGDAHLYGQALYKSLLSEGVTVHVGVEHLNLKRNESNQAELHVGDKILKADGIILACGAQTNSLLSSVNLSIDVHPVRGWAVDFPMNDNKNIPIVPVMDAKSRSAVTKFSDRIRLSGTWGAKDEGQLIKRWTEIAPEMMESFGKPSQIWSGLRPVSEKGRPFIGQTAVKNLYLNVGHGHMGWTLCAGSGAKIADILTQGKRSAAFAVP